MALTHKGEFHVEHGLGLPRKTTTERLAYTPSDEGYQVFDTTEKKIYFYNGTDWEVVANGAQATDLENTKVDRDGDTMTGELVLSGDPVNVLGATPKQYVDTEISTSAATKLNLTGGTMSGDIDMDTNQVIGLPATPAATGATSKEYVDGLASNYATAAQGALAVTALQTGDSIDELGDVDISTVAPTEGQTLVWNDTDGEFQPGTISADDRVLKTGDTMSGPLVMTGVNDFALTNTGNSVTLGVDPQSGFYSRFRAEQGSGGVHLEAFGGNSIANALSLMSAGPSSTDLQFVNNASETVFRYQRGVGGAVEDVFIFGKKVESPSTVGGDSGTTLATKDYVDDRVLKTGDAMTGGILFEDTIGGDDMFIGNTAGTFTIETALFGPPNPSANRTILNVDSGNGGIVMKSGFADDSGADITFRVFSATESNYIFSDLNNVDVFSYQTGTGLPNTDNLFKFGVKVQSPSTLSGDDDATLTTKDYVDNAVTSVDTSGLVQKSGDTMTGTLVIDAVQTENTALDIRVQEYDSIAEASYQTPGELLWSNETTGGIADFAKIYSDSSGGPSSEVNMDPVPFIIEKVIPTGTNTTITIGQNDINFNKRVESDHVVLGTDADQTLVTKLYVDSQITGNAVDAYTKTESDGTAGTAGAKTDKVASATAGNFAGLDASGNLTDSGSKSTDFATAAQGALADSALQNINALSIDELSDVDTTTAAPNSGEALVWDGTNFVPTDVSVDLSNYVTLDGTQTITGAKTFSLKVTAPSTLSGDVGTTLTTKDYVDAAVTTGTGGLATDDLTDVDTSTLAPASGHVLIHNGTEFANRALTQTDVADTATAAQGALADSAVQPGDATSTLTNNDAFVDLTTAQTVAGVKTFSDDINANGDVTIAGDLIVSGTTTSVNSTNTEIVDSIITLNKGETGAGVTNPNQSGIEIDRGTEDNKFLIWSESNDKFGQADVDGSGDVDVASFEAFALASDVANSSHVETFTTGDWTTGTPNTFVVTQATHGVAISPYYDITVYEGTDKVSIEVSVNATTGDVTLTTAGATFNGAVKISL